MPDNPLDVTCPKCGKPAGDPCYDIDGEFPVTVDPHPERINAPR